MDWSLEADSCLHEKGLLISEVINPYAGEERRRLVLAKQLKPNLGNLSRLGERSSTQSRRWSRLMSRTGVRFATPDRVALGRCRPEAPTDPYVLALEHTVLQIMGLLRV